MYQAGQIIALFDAETYWFAELKENVIETTTLEPPTTNRPHKNRRRRTVTMNSKDDKYCVSYFKLVESDPAAASSSVAVGSYSYELEQGNRVSYEAFMGEIEFNVEVHQRDGQGAVTHFSFSEEEHMILKELWNTTQKANERREERGEESQSSDEEEEELSDGDEAYSSSSDEEVPVVSVCF